MTHVPSHLPSPPPPHPAPPIPSPYCRAPHPHPEPGSQGAGNLGPASLVAPLLPSSPDPCFLSGRFTMQFKEGRMI